MKQLWLPALLAALLVSCQGDLTGDEQPKPDPALMTPAPVPAIVEHPLGENLSFTTQVGNWADKMAQVRLEGKQVGTVDTSGTMTVTLDLPPQYLYDAQTALLSLPPTAAQSPSCPLDQVTISDALAKVGRVDKFFLREANASGQLQPMLSPPLPVPAVERRSYAQDNRVETVNALIYADRAVTIKGQHTCRGTLWPWGSIGAPYQQAAAIHVQLKRGWNEVRFVTTYSEEQVQVNGVEKTEYRSALSVSGEKAPLPWKYNGVPLTYQVP